MNRQDEIGNLLEHIEILMQNVSNLKMPKNLSIATESGAFESIAALSEIQNKIQSYKKTAKILKDAIETLPTQNLATKIKIYTARGLNFRPKEIK